MNIEKALKEIVKIAENNPVDTVEFDEKIKEVLEKVSSWYYEEGWVDKEANGK